MSAPKKTNMSLTLAVTLQAALVTAVAMAGYAVIQYRTMPNHTILELILEHGWHVLALGTLTYTTLYFVMRKQVIQPIHSLFVKCYTISRGDHQPIKVSSRIREIQEIAAGINMLLERTVTPDPDPSLAAALSDIRRLAETAQEELFEIAPRIDADYLSEIVNRVEQITEKLPPQDLPDQDTMASTSTTPGTDQRPKDEGTRQ